MNTERKIKIKIKMKMHQVKGKTGSKLKVKIKVKVEMMMDKDTGRRGINTYNTSVLQNAIWVHPKTKVKIKITIKIQMDTSLLSQVSLLWNASSAVTVSKDIKMIHDWKVWNCYHI